MVKAAAEQMNITEDYLNGYMKGKADEKADEIIKNTYRTLMTRGMKGCYIYCTDSNLSAYLKGKIKNHKF